VSLVNIVTKLGIGDSVVSSPGGFKFFFYLSPNGFWNHPSILKNE